MSERDNNDLASAGESAEAEPTSKAPPWMAVQRCWFLSTVLIGLAILFVLPPFQGSDEYKHWLRAWSVAEGNVRCGEIPQAAIDSRHNYRRLRDRAAQVALSNTDAALRQEASQDYTEDYTKVACRYPPFAYVVPALALRTVVYFNGRVDKSDMIKAFYAGRVANWLCFCLVMYWFLSVMPAFRNLGLFFLSIPEVVEQASQYNTDFAQFTLMLILLSAVLRRPSRRRVVTIILAAILLTTIRPVYGLTGLLSLPGLVELYTSRGGERRRYLAVAFAAVLLPLLVWKVWVSMNITPAIFPPGVDPGAQISFLLHHPLHVFEVMWHQLVSLVGHNQMRGSWTSMLGGFGPARIELPMAAGYALLVGFALSAFSDFTYPLSRQAITPTSRTTRAGWVSWALATTGIALVIPAVVIAMYAYYTPVGADRAYGVQGRYYLVAAFMLIVFAIRFCRARWPRSEWSARTFRLPGSAVEVRWRTIAIAVAALVCLWADCVAINAIGRDYWYTG